MKKKILPHFLLILGVFILHISSASQLKKPNVESQETIEAFLDKVWLKNKVCLVPRFEKITSTILMGVTPTSVYVFDRWGNNLKLPGEANKCALDPALFIGRLDSNKTYQHLNSFTLDSIYSWFMKLNLDSFQKQNTQADYFVFVTWAIWPGIKIFKRDIQSCIDATNNNKTAVIEFTLINLDMQSSWGKENLKKIKLTKQSIEIKQ